MMNNIRTPVATQMNDTRKKKKKDSSFAVVFCCSSTPHLGFWLCVVSFLFLLIIQILCQRVWRDFFMNE